MTVVSSPVERVEWDAFLASHFRWKQGEHITLIGPTGCGKTTLTNELIPIRQYAIFLGSKKKDDTQDKLQKEYGFRLAGDPKQIHPDIARRWLVRPPFKRGMQAEDIRKAHREVFRETLMRAYADGGWTVFGDELRYLCDFLGLSSECVLLYTQGRSQGNSLVCGTQRPRHVVLEAYDQASHLFFWKDPDTQNVKRIAELAGVNRIEVARVVESLDWHDFLYVQPRTGTMVVSRVKEGK